MTLITNVETNPSMLASCNTKIIYNVLFQYNAILLITTSGR